MSNNEPKTPSPEETPLAGESGSGERSAPEPPESRHSVPTTAPWTSLDIEHLRTHFGLKDQPILARELNRSMEDVVAKAREIFHEPERTGPWTPDEVSALRRYLGAADLPLLGKIIGRSPDAINVKLVELAAALTSDPLDTRALAEFKRLYGTRSDEDLSLIFGRKLEVLQGLAKELCLSKDKGFMRRSAGAKAKTKMPRWSPTELERLRQIYPTLSNLEIAQELGRSVKSVVSKAHSLRLKKDKARLREMGQQNVQLRQDR